LHTLCLQPSNLCGLLCRNLPLCSQLLLQLCYLQLLCRQLVLLIRVHLLLG
jgi:hypothetical protein